MNKEEVCNLILCWIRYRQASQILLKCIGKGLKGVVKQQKLTREFKKMVDPSDNILIKILFKLSKKDLKELFNQLSYFKEEEDAKESKEEGK